MVGICMLNPAWTCIAALEWKWRIQKCGAFEGNVRDETAAPLNAPFVAAFFGAVWLSVSNSAWICIFTLGRNRNFTLERKRVSRKTRILSFIWKSPGFRAKSPYGRNASRRNFVCNVELRSDSRVKMVDGVGSHRDFISNFREFNHISFEMG